MLLIGSSPLWRSRHTAGRSAWWLPPGQPPSPHWLNEHGIGVARTELEIKHTSHINYALVGPLCTFSQRRLYGFGKNSYKNLWDHYSGFPLQRCPFPSVPSQVSTLKEEAAGTGWPATVPDCWTSTPPEGAVPRSPPAEWEVGGPLGLIPHHLYCKNKRSAIVIRNIIKQNAQDKKNKECLRFRLNCCKLLGVLLHVKKKVSWWTFKIHWCCLEKKNELNLRR